MSVINLEELLTAVSDDSPCGEDPTGNNEVQHLKILVGDADPDWAKIKREALNLLKEFKDLEIAFFLTLGLLKRDGIPGFAEGLSLCASLLEKWWEELYPLCDEDDGDPYERVGLLNNLGARFATNGDPYRVIEKLREAPLVVSTEMRKEITYRSILLSKGELSIADDETAPTEALIEAVFANSDAQKMAEISEASSLALESLEKINSVLSDKADESASFDPLIAEINSMKAIIDAHQSGAPVAVSSEESAPAADAAVAAAPVPVQKGVSGEVCSREDAAKALDLVIRYFDENEPSSPVPLMLERAKKMIGKNFRELVMDISYSAKQNLDDLFGEEEQN